MRVGILCLVLAACSSKGAARDPGAQVIELHRTVHFGAEALQPGGYAVAEEGEALVLLGADGARHEVAARRAEHEERLDYSIAITIPWGDDHLDVAVLHPDGTRLVATGSYSTVRTRGTIKPTNTAKPAYKAMVSSQAAAKTSSKKPYFPPKKTAVGRRLTKLFTYSGPEAVKLASQHQYMFATLANLHAPHPLNLDWVISGMPQDGVYTKAVSGGQDVSLVAYHTMTAYPVKNDHNPYFLMFYARDAGHERHAGFRNLRDYRWKKRMLPAGWTVEEVAVSGTFVWVHKPERGSRSLTFVLQMHQRGGISNKSTALVNSITLRGPATADRRDAFQLPWDDPPPPAEDDPDTVVHMIPGPNIAQFLRKFGYESTIWFPRAHLDMNPGALVLGDLCRATGAQDGLFQQVQMRRRVSYVLGTWESAIAAKLLNSHYAVVYSEYKGVDFPEQPFFYVSLYYDWQAPRGTEVHQGKLNGLRGRRLPPGWTVEDVQVSGDFAWERKPQRGDKELAMILRLAPTREIPTALRKATVDWIKLRGPKGKPWTDAIRMN